MPPPPPPRGGVHVFSQSTKSQNFPPAAGWILQKIFLPPPIRLISRKYLETEAYFPRLSDPTSPTGEVSMSLVKVLNAKNFRLRRTKNKNGLKIHISSRHSLFFSPAALSPFLKRSKITFCNASVTKYHLYPLFP